MPQTITLDGKDYVVLPISEYEALSNGAASHRQASVDLSVPGVETYRVGESNMRLNLRKSFVERRPDLDLRPERITGSNLRADGTDAREAEDADDEAFAAAAWNAHQAEIEAGGAMTMPRDYWLRLRLGEMPLTVFRDYRKLSKADLAEKSGVNRPEISDIESGKRRGSLDTWKALAKALNVSLDDLTTGYAAATGYTFIAENDGYRAIVPNLDINVFGETRIEAIRAADQLAVERWNTGQVRPELTQVTAEELDIAELEPEAFTVHLGQD